MRYIIFIALIISLFSCNSAGHFDPFGPYNVGSKKDRNDIPTYEIEQTPQQKLCEVCCAGIIYHQTYCEIENNRKYKEKYGFYRDDMRDMQLLRDVFLPGSQTTFDGLQEQYNREVGKDMIKNPITNPKGFLKVCGKLKWNECNCDKQQGDK